ncbi:MAG: hypothetical protein R6W90_15450 [Ignavibacteriaceae bacterium]
MDKSVEIYENKGKEFILFNEGKNKGLIKSKVLSKFEAEIEKIFKA